jgi:non-heme chloroperoxidase
VSYAIAVCRTLYGQEIRVRSVTLGFVAVLSFSVGAPAAPKKVDSSAHTVHFVMVAKDVKLEVIDWGGSGRPLIFLAGMGGTAHVFDDFAPKFTAHHHVYGITRRGFGASSRPAATVQNYSATRLGDDVLAVMDALKLSHPVLVGHSIAGEELSSVASRHPEKIAGAVYLDAGYGYSYYDRVHGDLWLDLIDVRKRIDALRAGRVEDRKPLWQDLLADTSRLEKALKEITTQMESMPDLPEPPPVARAIQFGGEKYTQIQVPVLAIFAIPDTFDAHVAEQVDAFESGLPSAHVVRLKNADHFVFRSNEADVLREMNAFLAKLP